MRRSLDFARCALDRLPSGLGGLLELRTLLLSHNQLTHLPPPPPPTTPAPAPAPAPAGSPVSRRQQQQQRGASCDGGRQAGSAPDPPCLPPGIERLVLAGNRFAALPAAALAACSALRDLDLSRCWQLQPTPAEWRGLLAALPRLRSLRHSCPLLAAEARGHGGAAGLAAALGASRELELEFCSASGSRWRGFAEGAAAGGGEGHASAGAGSSHGQGGGIGGSSKRTRSCGGLQELEAAAATLLGAGMSGGTRATLAQLAATASSGGGGAGASQRHEGGPGSGSDNA
jgi:hypothetical protein